MIDDTAIEDLAHLCRQTDTVGFLSLLIYPDGTITEYARLIDFDQVSKEMTNQMFKFYIDDQHYALWKAIEEKRDG